ncbi:right-handed parallel beta-helix repeat-containing protein, partial [bacterium]|nr:right-handed parallel beta-helix repeat-containing protein [bacterium]
MNQKSFRKNTGRTFSILLVLVLCGSQAFAQDHTIPGKVVTPYPTIINLAVEWYIQGDDNQNGIVSVQFREKGLTDWKQGMPLRRVPAGEKMPLPRLPSVELVKLSWENKHSGSIFDLNPDTEYEIKLKLEDPDGSSAEKMVEARTRPVPEIGKRAEIIELQPGIYDTLNTRSGSQDKPVVYRCSNGKAVFSFIDLQNRKWVFIEGLTINNKEDKSIGICLNGAENCVVRYCTVYAVYGIVAHWPGATNCYISDNVIRGICEWTNEAMGAHGKNIGEGIEMTGGGNVICYNRVTGFRDCISTMEDQHVVSQICIDIYNNDIYRGADDGIEADFCFSNCRIFRNRLTNCFVGLSS